MPLQLTSYFDFSILKGRFFGPPLASVKPMGTHKLGFSPNFSLIGKVPVPVVIIWLNFVSLSL